MSVLYVSDLDGTLLNSNAKLSSRALETLNELLDKGTLFSVASARSPGSVDNLLKGLRLRLTITLMNGAVLYDYEKRRHVDCKLIPPDTMSELISIFDAHGICPRMFVLEEEIAASYYSGHDEFLKRLPASSWKNPLRRFTKVERLAAVPEGAYIGFSVSDTYEALKPVCDEVRKVPGVKAEFYKDGYSSFWFLEIAHASATKSAGVSRLKELTGAERVVVFGDNLNDLDMFRGADEAYAVANAAPEVKAAAAGVIGSNDEDGVPLFIREKAHKFI